MINKRKQKRKNPEADFGNCITVERELVLTNGAIAVRKNLAYEDQHSYIVTKLFPNGIAYKLIRDGMVIPDGIVIHKGRI